MLLPTPDTFIFPNTDGGFMDTGNYRNRILTPLAEKLGLPKLNFQVLRRTMATLAQDEGSVKDIRGHMRHSKADTTANEYMQELPESVGRMVESMYEELKGYDFTVRDVEMKMERASVTKENATQAATVQAATGASPDHPTLAIRDPEPLIVASAGMAEESLIGVSFTGNPTVKHDGLEVSSVQLRGPADNIDIKPGDVIISIDGHYLYSIDDLRAVLRGHEQGGRLTIRYRRDRLSYVNYLVLKDAAPQE